MIKKVTFKKYLAVDEGNDPCTEALQELFKKVDSITTNV